MPEKWTGKLIGDMHNNGIKAVELANEMGCTKAYVSMVLNGRKSPKGGKERFIGAYKAILERRQHGERVC